MHHVSSIDDMRGAYDEIILCKKIFILFGEEFLEIG